MNSRRPVFLAIVTLIALGCDDGGDQGAVVRTDSAGIEIVTSVVDDRPLSWDIERGIALGGPSPELAPVWLHRCGIATS